jgi:phosphoglycolate phosphatase
VRTILWDLDGTLLTTRGAGAIPFASAIETVLGRKIYFDISGNAGLTDHQIAERYLLESAKIGEMKELIDSIVHLYSSKLRETFSRNKVKPLPGIEELLSTLKSIGNFQLAVVTGNCEIGAFEKLESSNLDKFFEIPNIFYSLGLGPRSEIVLRALRHLEISNNDAILVGDTIHDLKAAQYCSVPFVLLRNSSNSDLAIDDFPNAFSIGPEWQPFDFLDLLNKV